MKMRATVSTIRQAEAAALAVPAAPTITQLLQAWCAGDQTALDRLIPLVEAELRRLAHGYMRKERPGHTLQTSALIGEAYLRLINVKPVKFDGRAQFFALSAQLMRNILVDFARRHPPSAAGAAGAMGQVSLDEVATISRERPADLVALDEALRALAAVDLRKSQIVELRYFGGLSEAETAAALNVSTTTVKREWKNAKTWLYRELSKGRNEP